MDLCIRLGTALAARRGGDVKRIATHSMADGDAIASAWLAATYLFPGEQVEVAFVARFRPGQPAPAADCLVEAIGESSI
jgi:nanoRNase/pAp phosphatase (c-di-AMP/oligoRNAs hydrolase)